MPNVTKEAEEQTDLRADGGCAECGRQKGAGGLVNLYGGNWVSQRDAERITGLQIFISIGMRGEEPYGAQAVLACSTGCLLKWLERKS
jgi:hypothetical protein